MQVVIINPHTGQTIESMEIPAENRPLVRQALANFGDAPGVWIFGVGKQMFIGREAIYSMIVTVKEDES